MSNKKSNLLGMPFGTAASKLRKLLLFDLTKRLGVNICFRCKKPIETDRELSIEHTIPWQNSSDPIETYFDLSCIAFSHLGCNSGAAFRPHKKYFSEEDRKKADADISRKHNRKKYTPEKRRERYLRTGH